jgi:hypothetical protein
VRTPEQTAEEGHELKRRLEEMRAGRSVPHEVIVQETLEDMERDLRQMAHDYDGTDARAKELLEALVIARESGVKACDEIEIELAHRLLKSA